MLRLTSFEQLEEICARLHDCPFDLDSAAFDRSTSTWHGNFLRPDWENPAAEHHQFLFLYYWNRLPVFEGSLRLHHVSDVSVLHDQGIGTYSLNEVEQTSDGLRLKFNEKMSIKLFLNDSLEASYDERRKPGVWARYSELLAVLQSGPRIEYVG